MEEPPDIDQIFLAETDCRDEYGPLKKRLLTMGIFGESVMLGKPSVRFDLSAFPIGALRWTRSTPGQKFFIGESAGNRSDVPKGG